MKLICEYCKKEFVNTEEEFRNIDSEIERKRKSYEEQENAIVKVVMVEDCRAIQTKLGGW